MSKKSDNSVPEMVENVERNWLYRGKINKDLALILFLRKEPIKKIAQLFHVSDKAVYKALKPFRKEILLFQAFQENPAMFYEILERKLLFAVENRDIKNASIGAKITGAAICRDKVLAIKGKTPTGNIGALFQIVVPEDRAKELKEAIPDAEIVFQKPKEISEERTGH